VEIRRHSSAVMICFVLALGLLSAKLLTAQDGSYQPIRQWPGVTVSDHGAELGPARELLAVMISSSWCGGNAVDGFDLAIRDMKDILARRADSAGYSFSAIGVAVDWDVSVGVRYLLEGVSTSGQLTFGPWGEIVAGRDFLSSGTSMYALSKGLRHLTVPQVIVLERTVIPHESYVEVTEPLFLYRVSGGEDIVLWAEEGFPVPNVPHDPNSRPRMGDIR
jgi:hypothetical protein